MATTTQDRTRISPDKQALIVRDVTVGYQEVDGPRKINDILLQAKRQGCHVISLYNLEQIPRLHAIALRFVKITPGPGSTYPLPGGRVALHRNNYDMFARAGGVETVPHECRRTDDGKDPSYYEYETVMRFRDQCGAWAKRSARKTIDLRVKYEELIEKFREDVRLGKEKPENEAMAVKKKLMQIKKFMPQIAQTGSENRTIEKIFGLSKSYTLDELNREFVFSALVPQLDIDHEGDREFMRRQAYGATEILYGSPSSSNPSSSSIEKDQLNIDIPDDVIIDVESGDMESSQSNQSPDPSPTSTRAFSNEESAILDFQNLSKEEKIRELQAKAKEKNYTKPFTKPMELWDDHQMLEFFKLLMSLPDAKVAKPAKEQPLPFK